MGPVPLILAAASLAGAIFGGKRKHIDPTWLEQNFGSHAVSDEALQLFNGILNSPYGQHIMANAAEQGQQFARDTNRQAAQAGLQGPDATSGAGVFATSAAQGASDSLQRGVQSDFYQMVLPIAQQNVRDRMMAYLNDIQGGGQMTDSSRIWQTIGNAAGTTGALMLQNQKPKAKTTDGRFGVDDPKDTLPAQDRQQTSAGSPYRLPMTQPMLQRYNPRLSRFQSSFGAIQPGGSRLA